LIRVHKHSPSAPFGVGSNRKCQIKS
jgi:hypothetical protein